MKFLDDLKGFDVSDLDTKNIGAWPFPIMAIACLIVLILVPVIGYYFYVSDISANLDKARSAESELKKTFELKAAQAASLDVYKRQMEDLEKTFKVLVDQLPLDTEVPGLLEDVTKAGLTSGLEFNEIKLLPEVTQQFYIELPVAITVTGNYHSLANFSTKVAALPRIVTIDDFSMIPVKEGDSSKITISILAKTYRYRGSRN